MRRGDRDVVRSQRQGIDIALWAPRGRLTLVGARALTLELADRVSCAGKASSLDHNVSDRCYLHAAPSFRNPHLSRLSAM